MIRLINDEDKKIALAVEKETEHIAAAVDVIASQLKRGGRLLYCGCGTSGRLGVLDAVECPPTYSTDPDMVVGLIAGGYGAMFKAVEGAEDDRAASGRTPYVLGAMAYAGGLGAHVIGVTCCPGSPVTEAAEIAIAPCPGPEVVTGSTRMKSGTAQKMVLNMLSTGAMIKLGKVYGNLMVDVKPSNEKLVCRCRRIVCTAAEVDEETAREALEQCGYRPKTAIVMLRLGVNAEEARALLEQSEGRVAAALERGAKRGAAAL